MLLAVCRQHEVYCAAVKETQSPSIFFIQLEEREKTFVLILITFSHGRHAKKLETEFCFCYSFKTDLLSSQYGWLAIFPEVLVSAEVGAVFAVQDLECSWTPVSGSFAWRIKVSQKIIKFCEEPHHAFMWQYAGGIVS